MHRNAIFIRHGESTVNAGAICADITLVELTARGWEQAQTLAQSWSKAPDLIVTSPYTRAMQTAEPTINRFPKVPVEVWPIQEFTYLQPGRWNGTGSEERRRQVDDYWQTCDPDFCDGPEAESFMALLRRAEAALLRLTALPEFHTVLMFSHGQFIQAILLTILHPDATANEKMRLFGVKGDLGMGNTECIGLEWMGERWQPILDSPNRSHPSAEGAEGWGTHIPR